MERNQHPDHCVCEKCFERAWRIAGVVATLRKMPDDRLDATITALMRGELTPFKHELAAAS